MRKWLPLFPILLAVGLTAAVYDTLPPAVEPDWTLVLPLDLPAEAMGRLGFAVLLPAVAIATWITMVLVARFAGRKGGLVEEHLARAAIARFEPTYHIVVLAVVALIALLHVALLGTVAGGPPWTGTAVGVAMGLGLMATGNLMPRVRPNWIVGLRTRATLGDPELWLRTHRYFGGLLVIAGVGVIAVALLDPRFALAGLLGGILAAAVLAHLRGRRGRTKPPTLAAIL